MKLDKGLGYLGHFLTHCLGDTFEKVFDPVGVEPVYHLYLGVHQHSVALLVRLSFVLKKPKTRVFRLHSPFSADLFRVYVLT
jgi:hypothetical protein